ncbi:NAD(P)-binding protein [Trametopsis cervina]|nr:NAD(P)-binding protein [Trametopsis cervina]
MTEQSGSLVWLITGTSKGFGSHLTKIVLSRGDRVIASARSLDAIKHLESDRCRVMQLDITDDEEVIRAKAKEATQIWGRVDVLVNNAGIGAAGIAEEAGASGFSKIFQVNFFSAITVTNAFLPYMRAAKSGIVVFMGSRHAWMTRNPLAAPYNASKAALHAYAETLQQEIRQFGIRILIAQPGAHRTDVIPTSLSNVIVQKTIPAYEPLRLAGKEVYAKMHGKQPGDPEKAMVALVDVVRGEGQAQGRPMPLWLVLGEDAEQNLRDFCAERIKNLDEWQETTRSCTIPADAT